MEKEYINKKEVPKRQSKTHVKYTAGAKGYKGKTERAKKAHSPSSRTHPTNIYKVEVLHL